jgi:hypothetical protein
MRIFSSGNRPKGQDRRERSPIRRKGLEAQQDPERETAHTLLRLIQGDPANVFIAGFPFVWLPTILVPSAWLGHIVL